MALTTNNSWRSAAAIGPAGARKPRDKVEQPKSEAAEASGAPNANHHRNLRLFHTRADT